jgi:hypothetical protein
MEDIGIFYSHLVHFSPLHQEKSGNPASADRKNFVG